jgi:hypothetical protein
VPVLLVEPSAETTFSVSSSGRRVPSGRTRGADDRPVHQRATTLGGPGRFSQLLPRLHDATLKPPCRGCAGSGAEARHRMAVPDLRGHGASVRVQGR